MNNPLSQSQRADGGRQACLDEPGALDGYATEVLWCGRGHEHQREGDDGEAEAGEGGREQHLVHGDDVEAEDVEGYVLKRLDMVNDGKSEEEGKRG